MSKKEEKEIDVIQITNHPVFMLCLYKRQEDDVREMIESGIFFALDMEQARKVSVKIAKLTFLDYDEISVHSVGEGWLWG